MGLRLKSRYISPIVTLLFSCDYKLNMYHKKNRLVSSMSTVKKMNLVDFLDSMLITAIRLSYLIDYLLGEIILIGMLKRKLVFAYIIHCESINNN